MVLPAARNDSSSLIEFLVLRQIPHRAMSAGVEHGVVVVLLDTFEAHRVAEPAFGVGILFEPARDISLEHRLVTFWIQWRTSALGRCKGDLGAGVLEHVIRRGHFLQPEAGLAARVAELVMRGKNHQDPHSVFLSL